MKVAILAEQNFNLIDGSTIWLLNVCKLMSLVPGLEVSVLLTHKLTDPILADEVPKQLRLVDAAQIAQVTGMSGDKLEAASLVQTLRAFEAVEGRFERFFVRGESYLTALLEAADFAQRVVGYAPGAIPDLSQPEPRWMSLGRAARTPFVVQSVPAKHAMESLFGYPAHVVHVVPPIVFHDSADAPSSPERAADLTRSVLCYSGKVDLHYGLDWLIALARRLQDVQGEAGPHLGVSLIAGKDTWRTRYPEFFREMDKFRADIAAGHLPHVALASGLPHAQAKAKMAEADFAWCLRHARYDDVIEISTKIVEFCTLGVVPILNDTALNRALFGDDYPYLIDIVNEDAEARAIAMLRSKGSAQHQAALARIAQVAARFSADQLAGALGQAILGYDPDAPPLSTWPRQIHLATHDPKFLRQFLDQIQGDSTIGVTREQWSSTVKPEGTPSVPPGTDTVFCEWACGNAIWHSHNKRPGTKLIVRLHRFEAFREFPAKIHWPAVDALIVVSEYFRELVAETYGMEREKIHVMPQFIDWSQLRRPKLAQARHTLGLVGINPFAHKRFDRAIDFLAALRARDPRFVLAVRSVMPWQIDWVWNRDAEERAQFTKTFQRIYTDPLVAGAVRFDTAGSDMEEWYRGIGVILSSSDSEGCHTSVMEAMASGASAVVYDWPGARGLFAGHVYARMEDAVDDVIAFSDSPDLEVRREALSQSMKSNDVDVFARKFFQL